MKAEKVTPGKFVEIRIIDLGRLKLAEKSACFDNFVNKYSDM